MNDNNTYSIELDGLFSKDELNAGSPIEISIVQAGLTTQCVVNTDQSGLIGLLRHLHSRGLVLLSVVYEHDINQLGNGNVS
jgi:hypothetical protein